MPDITVTTTPLIMQVTVEDGPTLQVQVPAPITVEITPVGLQGPPGPPPPRYQHTQMSASDEWVVNHNLGAWATVHVFSLGLVEIDAEVSHTSPNQTRIRFNTAQGGIAVFH